MSGRRHAHVDRRLARDAPQPAAPPPRIADVGRTPCRPKKDNCQYVVADIQMPGMSGIEPKHALAAEALRTPAIVIGALGGDQRLVLAEKSGASFLRLPFDRDALSGLVTRSVAA
jgi:FixJ family two-component response regulator